MDTARGPDGKLMSNAAVASAITARTGVAISGTYLWQLRTGVKTNPTLAHLRAIGTYFNVPITYFIADEYAEIPTGEHRHRDGGDVTHPLRAPMWRISGLVSLEEAAAGAAALSPAGGAETTLDVARAAAVAAAERASAAVAAWVTAALRVQELAGAEVPDEATEATTEDALMSYLPEPRAVGVRPPEVPAAQSAIDELARRVVPVPLGDVSSSSTQ